MKVVLLLDWFLFYTTELANGLAERHEVLLVPRDHTHEISAPGEPTTLDAYFAAVLDPRVRTDRLRHRRSDPRNLVEVLRLLLRIRRWNPDAVHVQSTTDWRIVLLAWLLRRRVVVTIHDVETHPGESRGWQERVYRALLRRAHTVIVHGERLREQLRRTMPAVASRARVAVVPHGVLTQYTRWDDGSVAEEPLTVLFFGRMTQYKGLDVLVEAQPAVSREVPGARFVVAGRGPALKAQRAAMDASPAFEVHDRFIPNAEIATLFRRAAVVVLPYTEASQSGVVALAYAFGKPVVATDVGGLPESVQHDTSGLIVAPNDARALAGALAAVLRDRALRDRLSTGARRLRDTTFSWRTIADQTAALYRDRA